MTTKRGLLPSMRRDNDGSTTEPATELLFVASAARGHGSLGGVRSAMARAALALQLDAPAAGSTPVVRAAGIGHPVRRRTRRYHERRAARPAAAA
jgi:hypothetical protein